MNYFKAMVIEEVVTIITEEVEEAAMTIAETIQEAMQILADETEEILTGDLRQMILENPQQVILNKIFT